jgi:malonyl-CoA O-methyltransferase
MSSKIAENFSKSAPTYDQYATLQHSIFNELAAQIIIKPLSILDLGCGTGKNTKQLTSLFPNAKITAIDISSSMIKIAKEKHAHPNITYTALSVESWVANIKTLQFDLIISNATFQWISDLDPVIEKCKIALTPNGQLIFSTFGPKTYQELNQAIAAITSKSNLIAATQFRTQKTIKIILQKYFKNISDKTRLITQEFPSLIALLNKIKKTGTQTPNKPKSMWTPNLINKIEKIYLNKANSIEATYEIFFFTTFK